MTEDTYSEIFQYLDLLDEDSETEGEERLTFKGFLQLYQLQTGSFFSRFLSLLLIAFRTNFLLPYAVPLFLQSHLASFPPDSLS